MTPLEELVAAWEAWDDKPSAIDRTSRRMDALKAVAPTGWLVLSARVEQLRRGGLSARDAVTQAVEGS